MLSFLLFTELRWYVCRLLQTGEIKRTNIRGGVPRTLVEGGAGGAAAPALAVDAAARVLYHARGALHAADPAGTRQARLLPLQGNVSALANDPRR